MSEHRTARRIAFVTLAIVGVLFLIASVTIEIAGALNEKHYEVPHSAIYVGMILGFIGFYGLNPDRALKGGDFIVSSATRIITAVRTGRRSTDVVVTSTEVKPEIVPSSEPPSRG